jgi:hypothetical protein
MIYREAKIEDIPQIQIVRNSVKENVLSNPDLVTDQDCVHYMTVRGKGWVCEVDHEIVGFAIADLQAHNIWALFLQPEFEGAELAGRFTASCWIGIFRRQERRCGWEPRFIQERKRFTEKPDGQKRGYTETKK